MKTALVQSACECQARLTAELDEQCRTLHGSARLRTRELPAPANSVRGTNGALNVGWACPFCTRNVLRSFDPGALVFQEKATPSMPPGSRPAAPRSSAPSQ